MRGLFGRIPVLKIIIGRYTRPPLTKPLIIFVTMWFMLTEHGPDLSCCRGGGQWSRMAGVDPRVAWGVRELPESSAYMSRCRQWRKPRPIVCASTGSRSPETIDETRRPITMTVKNREWDLIWHISIRICRYILAHLHAEHSILLYRWHR